MEAINGGKEVEVDALRVAEMEAGEEDGGGGSLWW